VPAMLDGLRGYFTHDEFEELRVLGRRTLEDGFRAGIGWEWEDSEGRRAELLRQMDELGQEGEGHGEGETAQMDIAENEAVFDEMVAQLPNEGMLIDTTTNLQIIPPPAMDVAPNPTDTNPVQTNEDPVNEFITEITHQLQQLPPELTSGHENPVSEISDSAASSSVQVGTPDTPASGASGIDNAMREARNRQWETLRRRLSRQNMREGQGEDRAEE